MGRVTPVRAPCRNRTVRPLPYHGSALPTELRGRERTRLASPQAGPDQERHRRDRAAPATAGVRTVGADAADVRPTADDAEAIRAIYNVEVPRSTVTFDLVPRTLDDQLAWLAEHSGAIPAIVAVDERRPSSASARSARTRSGRPTAPPSRTRSTSHRDHRGAGVGRVLLGELVRLAADLRVPLGRSRAIVGGHDAVDQPARRPTASSWSASSARSAASSAAGSTSSSCSGCSEPRLGTSALGSGHSAHAGPGYGGPGRIRTSVACATGLQPVPFGHSGTDPGVT